MNEKFFKQLNIYIEVAFNYEVLGNEKDKNCTKIGDELCTEFPQYTKYTFLLNSFFWKHIENIIQNIINFTKDDKEILFNIYKNLTNKGIKTILLYSLYEADKKNFIKCRNKLLDDLKILIEKDSTNYRYSHPFKTIYIKAYVNLILKFDDNKQKELLCKEILQILYDASTGYDYFRIYTEIINNNNALHSKISTKQVKRIEESFWNIINRENFNFFSYGVGPDSCPIVDLYDKKKEYTAIINFLRKLSSKVKSISISYREFNTRVRNRTTCWEKILLYARKNKNHKLINKSTRTIALLNYFLNKKIHSFSFELKIGDEVSTITKSGIYDSKDNFRELNDLLLSDQLIIKKEHITGIDNNFIPIYYTNDKGNKLNNTDKELNLYVLLPYLIDFAKRMTILSYYMSNKRIVKYDKHYLKNIEFIVNLDIVNQVDTVIAEGFKQNFHICIYIIPALFEKIFREIITKKYKTNNHENLTLKHILSDILHYNYLKEHEIFKPLSLYVIKNILLNPILGDIRNNTYHGVTNDASKNNQILWLKSVYLWWIFLKTISNIDNCKTL